MAEYDNTNSGVLFKNDKATSEKAPAYKGKINVDGKDYELAAWIKEGKSGKFMSLKVQEPFKSGARGDAPVDRQAASQRAMDAQAPSGGSSGFDDLENDIPF